MFPRNAASPPRIAIGAVVQISDGAVQSSGVSVVVRPEGGSETAGGGTISYGGSSSVVYYVPTQAETDYTAFVVTAYKSGCIPVSVTVVTTNTATPGTVDIDSIAGSASAATNQKNAALAMLSGAVATAFGSANTNTEFDTDLPVENANYYGSSDGGMVLAFVSTAAHKFQTRRLVASVTAGSNTRVTVEQPFDGTPADGDAFVLLGRITELS